MAPTPPPQPIDADLVAFGLMLSGMASMGLATVWALLCFGGHGPFGATLTMTMWAVRRVVRDPFPLTSLAYWAATTDSFPAWPTVKVLIGLAWLGLCACGLVGMAVDAVKGPREERIFVDQYGRATRTVTRMKEKRVMPEKMDKAVKAVTPARDRLAYELKSRRDAKNESRAAAGLGPLKESWARRKLTAALPTGKVKEPRLSGKEKKQGRADALAEVAALRSMPAAPATADTLVTEAGPLRAGYDPAAPPAAPTVTDVFGQPLTAAGRRFFALRDSGYRGWIDQDGYAVDKDGARIDPGRA